MYARRRSSYGRGRSVSRRRAPVGSRAVRRIMPRMRTLSRLPAGLYSGRRTGATELKCVDGGAGFTTLGFSAAGGTALVLPPPKNGSAFNNRIGTRTRAVSLELRGHIFTQNNNAAVHPQQFARVIVLYDRQTNGSLPSVADVLTDVKSDDSTSTGSVFCGINMNNRDRFLILRDRKIVLMPVGANGTASANGAAVFADPMLPNSYMYHEFIKLKGLESHYKASSSPGVIGDIATGSFIILVISSEDADGTANAWALKYGARFKFFD